jgi:hypothetical protein
VGSLSVSKLVPASVDNRPNPNRRNDPHTNLHSASAYYMNTTAGTHLTPQYVQKSHLYVDTVIILMPGLANESFFGGFPFPFWGSTNPHNLICSRHEPGELVRGLLSTKMFIIHCTDDTGAHVRPKYSSTTPLRRYAT